MEDIALDTLQSSEQDERLGRTEPTTLDDRLERPGNLVEIP